MGTWSRTWGTEWSEKAAERRRTACRPNVRHTGSRRRGRMGSIAQILRMQRWRAKSGVATRSQQDDDNFNEGHWSGPRACHWVRRTRSGAWSHGCGHELGERPGPHQLTADTSPSSVRPMPGRRDHIVFGKKRLLTLHQPGQADTGPQSSPRRPAAPLPPVDEKVQPRAGSSIVTRRTGSSRRTKSKNLDIAIASGRTTVSHGTDAASTPATAAAPSSIEREDEVRPPSSSVEKSAGGRIISKNERQRAAGRTGGGRGAGHRSGMRQKPCTASTDGARPVCPFAFG